ncbi:hypothetical protein BGZ81_006648 [Podila clonocystis]|nr:hypothetical protein BGZ81_006648 [Podila clonocystis]
MTDTCNPLLLPELLNQIAEFFTPAEAATPSLVSRSWHEVFSTRIWQHLDLQRYSWRPQYLPRQEEIVKNASKVRHLKCGGKTFLQFSELPYTRLTKLEIFGFPTGASPGETGYTSPQVELWQRLIQLAAQNSHLDTINISLNSDFAASRLFWPTFATLPALRSVSLCYNTLTAADFVILWNNCQSVRLFEIFNIKVLGAHDIHGRLMPLPQLQELAVDETVAPLVLKLCPNIRIFNLAEWSEPEEDPSNQVLEELAELGEPAEDPSNQVLEELADHLRDRQLQQLRVLRVYRAENRRLAACLRAIDHLTEFCIEEGTTLGDWIFRALDQHFATLQCLWINVPVPSEEALSILESCPRLTSIHLPHVKITDVIGRKPWSCLNLESFSVGIHFDESEQSPVHTQSRAIFKQLSRLKRLKILIISRLNSQSFQGLDLSLNSGLDQLATLENLQKLDFRGSIQNMSAEDIAWMGDTWKRLRIVEGKCNKLGRYGDQPNARILLN